MRNKKREALIEAGMRLFVEQGFHGTPTSQISKEAGVATGTLFNHFSTKEELINGIYIYAKDKMLKKVLVNLENCTTIRSSSLNIWENYLKWGVENPYMVRFFRIFASSPYISNFTREEATKGYKAVLDMIMEAQKQEIFRSLDWELLYGILTDAMNTAVLFFVDHPDKFKDEKFREETLNLFWDIMKI